MDAGSVLIAAASTLGVAALEESTKLAIAELWSRLKSAIKRKHGADSIAIEVLDEVERMPTNAEPSPMLCRRVEALRLGDDPDIAIVLSRIEALLKERAPGMVTKQYTFSGNTFTNTHFN